MSATLVLIGAGAHGRGTIEILEARRAAGLDTPQIIGLVDDAVATHGKQVGGYPVIGGLEALLALAPRPLAIISLTAPEAKRRIAEWLDRNGFQCAGAIHPSVQMARGVTIAAGAIVNAGVSIAFDAAIGRHTTVNLNATVGHDCRLGDFATVAPGVNIAGNVTIGEGAEIQTNATLVPGLTIGAGARVGPGSVVLRDVEPGALMFGNPARKMPRVERDEA